MATTKPWAVVALAVAVAVAFLAFAVPVSAYPTAPVSPRGFVHITDVHLDDYYLAGSDDKSTTCHRGRGKAGTFGTRGRCDAPKILAKAAFRFLERLVLRLDEFEDAPVVDFVLWTGDNARHDHDESLKRPLDEIVAENQEVANLFYDLVRARREAVAAGRMDSQLVVLPVIGNNDVYPHNQMEEDAPILANLTQMWSPFLSKQAAASLSRMGSYVEQVRPGLLVVVVNSIHLMGKNKESASCDDSKSPAYAQMRWFEDQLRLARQQGQRVIVAGHVPPSKGNYHKHCVRQYNRLAGEYQDVISGHLYGHTHDDQFYLIHQDSGNDATVNAASSPVGVVLIAPSLMPSYNPALRLWHYNDASVAGSGSPLLLDYEQYYVDLTKANQHPDALPEFVLEYTLAATYSAALGDGGVTPETMAALDRLIDSDEQTRRTYDRLRTVSSGLDKSAKLTIAANRGDSPNAFCACPLCVEPYEDLAIVRNQELWQAICETNDVPGVLAVLDFYMHHDS